MKFCKLLKKETQLLFKHFDRDGDGFIDYSEFVAFVLPNTDLDKVGFE